MSFISKKTFIIIVAVLTACPPTVFSGEVIMPHGPSIAVVPLVDGNSDDNSGNIAREIAGALKFLGAGHVIDTDLVARVSNYSQNNATLKSSAAGAASDALASAKENFFQFRYNEAEKGIKESIALLQSEMAGNPSAGALLVDAYVSRAVIAKSRGDAKGVRESLAAALDINPRLDLKSEEYPPSIVSALEEERAALAERPAGTLIVSSRPAAAEVYINGVIAGVTPLKLEAVPAGNVGLSIRAGNYEAVERNVSVPAGKVLKISERLKWTGTEGVKGSEFVGDATAEVREGIRVAGAIKATKAIIIDVDEARDGEEIRARMVDSNLKAGHKQIILKRGRKESGTLAGLADISRMLADEMQIDLTKDPARHIDPLGIADPILLDRRKRHFEKSPVFWGVVGALAAGALGGGIAAALSGGGGDGTGNVRVNFKSGE